MYIHVYIPTSTVNSRGELFHFQANLSSKMNFKNFIMKHYQHAAWEDLYLTFDLPMHGGVKVKEGLGMGLIIIIEKKLVHLPRL